MERHSKDIREPTTKAELEPTQDPPGFEESVQAQSALDPLPLQAKPVDPNCNMLGFTTHPIDGLTISAM